MLPYMTATKPYYYPVVIVPMLIGAVSQTINKVSKSALPVTLPFRYHLNEDLRVIKVVCKNIEHVCFLSVCRGSGTLILDVSLQLSKSAPSEVLKQLRFLFP